MLKIDEEPIAPRLLNNRTAHSNYLRHTQEQAVILGEIVAQGKSQNPLNNSLDSACKYTKRIQELLIIIRQTCPGINKSSDKLVAVTPKNKDKRNKTPSTSAADHSLQADPKKRKDSANNQEYTECSKAEAHLGYKKKPHKPKSEDTNQEKLYLLLIDLCGPMHVANVNGKKYILVIVDDYSRFTWVKTDNETEFVNQALRKYYEKVGISHDTSVTIFRTPRQNGDDKRLKPLEPVLHEMTPATINSGLVPNPPPSTPFVPPLRTDWDLLFQPLFDELLNPPSPSP
ncbi:retrovirus-related pol polyprotein from transposon TNT 1-94 [Tanacetum coccineum]